MRIYFLVIVLSSCVACGSVYPDGHPERGSSSYQGQALSLWQDYFREELCNLLKTDSVQWDYSIRQDPRVEIKTPSSWDDQEYLMLSQKFDVVKNYDHCEVYSNFNPDYPVRLYDITFSSFDGEELSAFLLVPHQTMLRKLPSGKVPSLIYYHGHGSHRFSAAFDMNDYAHGMGFRAALQGYIVLVPNIRSFSVSSDYVDHLEYHEGLSEDGELFLSYVALDASYAQDILDSGELENITGYEVDRNFNFIAGVSLGGHIAHIAAALDHRFDAVSIHGMYFGYEMINSDFHCACQQLSDIEGVANIFDVSMLIPPRLLHIGMGGSDPFFNGYSLGAIMELITNVDSADENVCAGKEHDYGMSGVGITPLLSMDDVKDCVVIIEIAQHKRHEFISAPSLFSDLIQFKLRMLEE